MGAGALGASTLGASALGASASGASASARIRPDTQGVCFGKKGGSVRSRGGGGLRRGSPESVMDDPSIVRLFEQLYQEVHTWSSEFLAGSPSETGVLTTEDETQIRHVVLVDELTPILEDRSLRRKVVEGMVGYTISFLEARQGIQAFWLPQ